MKLTVYSSGPNCEELVEVKIAHVTMFEKHELSFYFIDTEEQMKLINCFIKHHVLFTVQGTRVILTPEERNFQRVRYRLDG